MAMKRDSFLFYRDWAETLKGYPIELKCEIFDAIVDLALNCEEKEDLTDTAKLIFDVFRPKILRDAEKYQEVCERNWRNGRRGGRPRKVLIGALGENPENPVGILETQKTQQNPKNPLDAKKTQKTQQNPKNPLDAKKTQKTQRNPKNLDNDNENDNDSDNENENDINSSNIIDNIVGVDDNNSSRHQQILNEFLGEDLRIEQLCMSLGIGTDTCKRIASDIVNEWDLTGITHNSKTDAKQHLLNLIKIKSRDYRNGNNRQSATAAGGENPLDRATVHNAKIG